MTKYFGFYVVTVNEVDGSYHANVKEEVTNTLVYDGPVYGGTIRTLNDAADGIARWLGLTD